MPVAEIFFLMHSQPYANTREVIVCSAEPAVTKCSKGSDPHAIGCSLGSCRLEFMHETSRYVLPIRQAQKLLDPVKCEPRCVCGALTCELDPSL
jgi:hypothetical protein